MRKSRQSINEYRYGDSSGAGGEASVDAPSLAGLCPTKAGASGASGDGCDGLAGEATGGEAGGVGGGGLCPSPAEEHGYPSTMSESQFQLGFKKNQSQLELKQQADAKADAEI